MSEAERLVEAYADAVATHRLESLYGTSKGYTLEKARERDEAHEAMAAELRRLSAELEECQAQRRAAFRRIEEQDKELEALKKAMGEPVAWMRKWAHDGVKPRKEKNEAGRWAWPGKFKLLPVTEGKCMPDDVPLYALTKDQS